MQWTQTYHQVSKVWLVSFCSTAEFHMDKGRSRGNNQNFKFTIVKSMINLENRWVFLLTSYGHFEPIWQLQSKRPAICSVSLLFFFVVHVSFDFSMPPFLIHAYQWFNIQLQRWKEKISSISLQRTTALCHSIRDMEPIKSISIGCVFYLNQCIHRPAKIA